MDPNNPGHAQLGPDGQPVLLEGLYHPTFLYELIWNLLVALLVWAADRRFKFGRGRAFALYVMAYTVGRGVIETMRTDEANEFFGVRLNVWTSIVVFLGALIFFMLRKGPREYVIPEADGGKGWQIVTEEQYDAFVASGERPEAPVGSAAEAGDDPDEAADDDPDEPGAEEAEGAADDPQKEAEKAKKG
jgi:hypothetical protein